VKETILIVLVLFFTSITVRLAASQSAKPLDSESSEASLTMREGLAKKISLDLRGMDIIDTIKFLAMKGNLNIVTSKNVKGRITLFLKNVTIGQVLDVILLTNKLACEKKKNIITIMTEAEYEAIYGKKYVDKRGIKTIKLKYALPTKVGKVLENLKSTIGKIIMDDATGTIVLIDIPEKIEEMEKVALSLDKGLVEKVPRTVSKVFELKYANVKELEPKITKALSPGIGSVEIDERTNKLIIRDLPYKIKEFEELIRAFDSKTREVVIEAKIIEVTLNDDSAFGINWEEIFTAGGRSVHLLNSFPFSSPSGTAGNYGKISIGTWEGGVLDEQKSHEILTFLKSVGKIKIVSSPHIAVCNNEEAKIMVGTRQPYATSTLSQSDVTTTTSWNAEFVDLGVTLAVTPTINKDGFIKMHIKPEVSTLTGWFEVRDESGADQIKLPEVDTSNAEATVLVQDGRTIIIAGMIKYKNYKKERKPPYLGDVPILGSLFKSKATGTEKKELVILLTPHIISGGEDLFYLKEKRKPRKPPKGGGYTEERKQSKLAEP